MVVRREQHVALEALQRVVEGLYRFQVEVVGGRVEYHGVGVFEHHAGNHAAHLLTTREDRCLFEQLFAREEHATQESLDVELARVVGELGEPFDQVHVGIEEGAVVERQVGRGDGLSPLVGARIGFHVAVDDFEEGGHGTRVVRDEGHLVVLLDGEVHIFEKQCALDRLFEPFHFENLVARLARRGEDDARVAARRGLNLLDGELFEHLLAAGGLFRLGHVGAEPLDKFEQLLALLLGLLVLLLLLAQGQLARLVPEAVIAGKELHLAVVDVDRVGAHRVEEVTVVRYHQYCVLEVGQVVFEPHHRFEVEVVGRLVEQQVVGVAEEGLGQQHAYLLLTTQVLHEHVVLLLLDAQTAQQRGGVALGIPPFEFGELLFEFGGPYAVGIAEIGFGIEGVLLLHDVPQYGVAHEYGVDDGKLVEGKVVLTQYREPFARSQRDGTVRGFELVAQDTHEGRFPGAVGSDNAVAVARGELQINVLEKNSFTKLNT